MEQEKPKKGAKQKPEKVFSKGQMSVALYEDQAPSGYRYPTVKLFRTWKALGTGKTLHSDRFFIENEEDAIVAIKQACAYKREHEALLKEK